MIKFKPQKLSAFLARLSPREKAILYGTIVVVSLTAIDRLVINPVISKMDELNKRIEERQAIVKRNLRLLAHKERIMADSAKYGAFLSEAKSEEEESTTFLKEIESLANKSSVYLTDMKPGSTKASGSSKKYLINLNFEAQIEDLINFMYNIENTKQLVSIEKYRINPKAKDETIAECSLTVSKIVISQE